MNLYEKGQFLVELIIAFFVMALVVVAIVGLSTTSVKNSSSTRDKTVARKYAEEGMEWIRKRRDVKWQSLWAHGGRDNFKTFCFNSFPYSEGGWVGGNCGDSFISGTIFSRELRLQRGGEDALDVQVVVSWDDSQGSHEVKLETKLYNLK